MKTICKNKPQYKIFININRLNSKKSRDCSINLLLSNKNLCNLCHRKENLHIVAKQLITLLTVLNLCLRHQTDKQLKDSFSGKILSYLFNFSSRENLPIVQRFDVNSYRVSA